MPWGYKRRNPNRDYGPSSYSYEDPDTGWAVQDYGAAVQGMEVDERPPYDPGEWRDADAQPTHPAWSCQGCGEHPASEPEPEPEPPGWHDDGRQGWFQPGRWA